jgi:23S rRNA U2552 (ribose-2'-O)-methylase RlmE/FtsJ
MKQTFGGKHIKVFKPQASRKNSKETYIVKSA